VLPNLRKHGQETKVNKKHNFMKCTFTHTKDFEYWAAVYILSDTCCIQAANE